MPIDIHTSHRFLRSLLFSLRDTFDDRYIPTDALKISGSQGGALIAEPGTRYIQIR